MTYILLTAFTIVLFIRPQEIYPALAVVPFQKILGIAALVSCIPFMNSRILSRFNNQIIKYAFFYLLAIFISIPFSLWPGGSISFIQDILMKQIIILFIMVIALDSREKIKKFVLIIGSATFVLALLTITRYLGGQSLVGGYRATVSPGTFGDPNDLALHFVFSIPLLYFAGYLQAKKKGLFALMIFTLMAAVFITFSRGGILGLFAAIISIWFFDKVNRKKNTRLIMLPLVMVFLLNIFPAVITRMQTLTGAQNDPFGTIEARWITLKHGIQVFIEHPLVGVGVASFPIAEGMRHGSMGKWNAAHNSFLEVGAETGIVGLIAFSLCCYLLLSGIKAGQKKDIPPQVTLIRTGVRVSSLAYLVCATFLSQAYSWYFFYLLGLTVAMQNLPCEGEKLCAVKDTAWPALGLNLRSESQANIKNAATKNENQLHPALLRTGIR